HRYEHRKSLPKALKCGKQMKGNEYCPPRRCCSSLSCVQKEEKCLMNIDSSFNDRKTIDSYRHCMGLACGQNQPQNIVPNTI
ncbi:MAG: hypothetical protein OQK53_09670, partial [Rhodospirillales bacterium]|nr:hypothetical protein [Rhodospirillales bacterium]